MSEIYEKPIALAICPTGLTGMPVAYSRKIRDEIFATDCSPACKCGGGGGPCACPC